MNLSRAALSAVLALASITGFAADYPAPKQGDWIARDFRFHTGDFHSQIGGMGAA